MKTRGHYILAIDQGTSGTKAIVFDDTGSIICKGTATLASLYPETGYVEQDPMDIYNSVTAAVGLCLRTLEKQEPGALARIACCGISNQRETFVLWDKTGNPLHHAVVWQCKRSLAICDELTDNNYESEISGRTGLTIDPYFSASKLTWLVRNNQQIRKALANKEAYFGTVDTWLLYKLSGGKSFKTDYTNASRTLFFNIHTLEWDNTLLNIFEVTGLQLPEPTHSADLFGQTDFHGLLPKPIPVSGILGDSQAAFFGEGCFTAGMAKATMGTGCSIMLATEAGHNQFTGNALQTIGWSYQDRVIYAAEGIIISCGATLEWLRTQLEAFEQHDEIIKMALSLPSNEGVYLIPAFSGMGAPYWQQRWKASVHGITFGTSKVHLVRAALESIAYQIRDVIESLELETRQSLKDIRVNGGISKNHFVMQFLANLIQKPVICQGVPDISAWGAALISGLGANVWESLDNLPEIKSDTKRIYQPEAINKDLEVCYKIWQDLISNKTY